MYNNMYPYGQPIQQQLAQNRMEQLQQQYNGMFQPNMQMQQQQQNIIKGRPVSGIEEARAAMIDLDGSLFVFTDIANKKIYTKQIQLDGSAEVKTYKLVEQPMQETKEIEQSDYVLRSEFENALGNMNKQFKQLQEELGYDAELSSTNGK
mgnify:FL=1